MPVETAKCWWLLKIEPNAWAGGKGSCSVCVDLQAVGALEFFGELYSLAKGFGPFFEGVWAGFREREGSIFSNHQHFAVSTGICGVACPLPASRVDKPLLRLSTPHVISRGSSVFAGRVGQLACISRSFGRSYALVVNTCGVFCFFFLLSAGLEPVTSGS